MSAGGFTAIVPMKGNSQRVPGKNVRPIAGKPLYHWITEELAAAQCVEQIVIETDADHIAEDARRSFPDAVVLRRPDRLKGDTVSMNDLLAWHQTQLEGERFIQTHATNPMITAGTFDAAAAAFKEPGPHDSLFSVNRWQTRLYYGDGTPLNHDPEVLIQTQDLEPLYEENSCLYFFTRASFAKKGRRIGERPKLFETPPFESIDIDEEKDFTLAEFLIQQRESGKA
jgi:CMP-N-acetylneuraminic acid synthetase